MDAELPQYDISSTPRRVHSSGVHPSSIPRPSSERPTASEHSYHLSDSKGRPWLSLNVFSHAPTSAHLPAFFEGEAIGGEVILHSEKDNSIKSITVQVLGQIASSAMEVVNFLQVSKTLWSSSASQPTLRTSQVSDHTNTQLRWPFSLNLPSLCQIKGPKGSVQSYSLPASFTERMARNHIQYRIVATVLRSRFRVDNTIGTVIGYCPIIRPGPPSIARQAAYLQGIQPPGPEADPHGWRSLRTSYVTGSVFSTRTVDAKCTLSLAIPLCYTRGGVIPCAITVECSDIQALDLLSTPRSLVVRLLRRIAHGQRTLLTSGGELPGIEYEHEVQELATAVWQSDGERHPTKRTLYGEIHIPSTLKPTCRLGAFEIMYFVAFYPPRAAGFQHVPGGVTDVLHQEPITIGTAHAPGPRPRKYSPPSYEDVSSVTGRDSEFCLFR